MDQATPAPRVRDTILEHCLSEADRYAAIGARDLAGLWERLAEARRETIALHAARKEKEARIV